ncbi:DUF429 domain-containing protein [Mycobacterium sp. TY815]|uniref:DUF429 domain-containing protein n=1 Tax=Mycobacterium sp. TY815 TaxID=3050581 RepID=UPI0027403374|nr:DUF429 domain-containing protein [Mycobacterium sp. TY815]MDP7707436.1 DUF429 domain-containing protein [Mycobacterium sp. TY815]
MNFIGLDLAWGSRTPDPGHIPNRTGIAVLNSGGYLTYLGTHVFDDDIVATVSPYARGSCVVAIDAPLKITNQDGQRLAETTLGRDFARFDAGANSANIARFSADPRGARLARALDLDIDPHSARPRRAIEVYSHPATVALFQLGRIFKFKKGTPAQRKPEMLRYIRAIESLASAPVPIHVVEHDEWNDLRRAVEKAERQLELNRAEDQIDAVMCAYVAVYAQHRPDDVTIYGDFPANGYILTPTLPRDIEPTPRRPPVPTPPLPPAIAAQYARCSVLLAAIRATFTEIEGEISRLVPSTTHTMADVAADLLSEAEAVLAQADLELATLRARLRSPSEA